MKKILSVLLCVLFAAFALCMGACEKENDNGGNGGVEGGQQGVYGDPTANDVVPGGHIKLEISQDSNGNSIYGVGVELDPHFHYGNVGRTGVTEDGVSWECKEEDWENIYLPRMKEMNLKRLRVMLLYSWYVNSEADLAAGNFHWDSKQMQSLYKVLDAAQENGMDVNITLWGVGGWMGGDWLVAEDSLAKDDLFAQTFAAAIKYLLEEKKYTCIKEITPFNEPNSGYVGALGPAKGFQAYEKMCRELDKVFKEEGLRDKVKFNLSDDARSATWLEQTLDNLAGIYDIVNSHTYDYKIEDGDDFMIEGHSYAISDYTNAAKEFGATHMFGEFGTGYTVGSHHADDKLEPSRGLLIARIAINMLRAGSCGFSYWPLFSEYYSDNPSEQIMDMGLWGFADEGYACRPVYYAYSMFTRFCLKGMEIYPIETRDDNITAVALKSAEGKWSYFVVNHSETESKKIAFLNHASFPETMKKYVYDQNNVPTDNKPVAASGTLTADGRVLADTLAPLTFAVYSDLV